MAVENESVTLGGGGEAGCRRRRKNIEGKGNGRCGGKHEIVIRFPPVFDEGNIRVGARGAHLLASTQVDQAFAAPAALSAAAMSFA